MLAMPIIIMIVDKCSTQAGSPGHGSMGSSGRCGPAPFITVTAHWQAAADQLPQSLRLSDWHWHGESPAPPGPGLPGRLPSSRVTPGAAWPEQSDLYSHCSCRRLRVGHHDDDGS
eukprot:2662318-Rhodomonas_salina.1